MSRNAPFTPQTEIENYPIIIVLADSFLLSVRNCTTNNLITPLLGNNNKKKMPPPLPSVSDEAIMSTNDDAFETKLAALGAGYYRDDILIALFRHLHESFPLPKRSALINRGTHSRVGVKTALVECFASSIMGDVQVVSLGAGYDSLGLEMVGKERVSGRMHYLELDFERVAQAKGEAVMAGVGGLKGVNGGSWGAEGFGKGGRYCLSGFDLRQGGIGEVFERAGLKKGVGTLVVAEIVLVYMGMEFGDKILRECAEWFSDVRGVFIIEHVHGGDGFGREMERAIAERGSPLTGICGSVDKVRERVRAAGFGDVWGGTLLDAWRGIAGGRGWGGVSAVEGLDEVEELELLMGHYCVVLGIEGGEPGVLKRILKKALPCLLQAGAAVRIQSGASDNQEKVGRIVTRDDGKQ